MRKMLQYLKNKDSKQTDTFLTLLFQGFMKYPEHTREVCTEDAANGTFIQGPGAIITAKHHAVGQHPVMDPGNIIPRCVFQLHH